MQKRNYYRAGWIKFDLATDVQSHIATLSERKVRIIHSIVYKDQWNLYAVAYQIEGFKLHVTHNSEAFTGKVRYTPEGASRPERIAKDLANAKKLASLLEEEYEQLRTFKPKHEVKDGEGEGEGTSGDDAVMKEATNGGALPDGDILTVDAMAEDEPPSELGSAAIEKRIANSIAELPEPQDDEAAKALELKRVRVLRLLATASLNQRDFRIPWLLIFTLLTYDMRSILATIVPQFAIIKKSCKENA